MKFIRYSKFKGFNVSDINLGDLMQSLSDSLLDSGYNEDYFWTRQSFLRKQRLDGVNPLRQRSVELAARFFMVGRHRVHLKAEFATR